MAGRGAGTTFSTLSAEAIEYQDSSFGSLNQEIPYLDSFMKETARLSPGPLRKLSVFAPRKY